MNQDLDIIARLDGVSFEWSQLGTLYGARKSHNAIKVDGSIFIIGGKGRQYTEKCTDYVCTRQDPDLEDFGLWPELLQVSIDFCT